MVDPRRDPRQMTRTRRPRPGTEGRDSPGDSGPRRLLVVTATLLLLIVLARLTKPPAEVPVVAIAKVDTAQIPAAPPVAVMSPPAAVATPAAETPTLDLLVRVEARRRIDRAGASVYLDSLLAESDSTLRRWPERPGEPVTVAFVRDSLFELADGGDVAVREAFRRWLELPLGLEVSFVEDTTMAQVVVKWRDRFDPSEPRTGQTDLEVSSTGAIQHGRLSLALKDPTGRRLDRQAQLVTAMHEVGHVLGLAHSGNAADLMFPSPRAAAFSERDRRTVELIYGLPPGSVKGQ
jgi:hypothetical protein